MYGAIVESLKRESMDNDDVAAAEFVPFGEAEETFVPFGDDEDDGAMHVDGVADVLLDIAQASDNVDVAQVKSADDTNGDNASQVMDVANDETLDAQSTASVMKQPEDEAEDEADADTATEKQAASKEAAPNPTDDVDLLTEY